LQPKSYKWYVKVREWNVNRFHVVREWNVTWNVKTNHVERERNVNGTWNKSRGTWMVRDVEREIF